MGRSATTISSITKQFSVSHCYFDTTDNENGEQIEHNIENMLKNYLVSGKEISANVFLLMNFLFASLCFHYDTLQETEDARSALRTSTIF